MKIIKSKIVTFFRVSLLGRVIAYILCTALLAVLLFGLLNFEYVKKRILFFSEPNVYAPPVSHVAPVYIEPNRLIIQSLKIDAPIQYAKEAKEDAFQEALVLGVVHYPQTAKPGEPGNVYIFGHSSDFSWSRGKYKTVFALLPNIVIGAEIVVSDDQGKPYTYVVRETKVVSPKDLSVLEQDKSKKILSVQTSYPVGTALKRFVVIAELKVNQ